MKGTKNINKKLLITIFTFLFLIRLIYSVYSQATSPQNNAASSLGSNSIIQWIITSSANGYSNVAQYIANFISIKGIPTYVWTIITFLMATLFFIAIYLYLFEIFVQRTKISESETMKKAKILFIFALSVFSAIAIGFAIPFLFNLYGFILLILLLIALFFFGRATISYGRSFHHSIKSFSANVEKDLINAEGELKKARKNLSEQEARYLIEGIEKVHNDLGNVMTKLNSADIKFNNVLSDLMHAYSSFINSLINDYNSYLNRHKKSLQPNQIKELESFIKSLGNKRRNSLHTDNQHIPSIRQLHNYISRKISTLTLNNNRKQELQKILDNNYHNTHSQILSEIQEAINEYNNVRISLMKFHQYEDAFKRDINLRFRQILRAPDSRKYEIGILSALDKSKNEIDRIENLVNERIQFLESLLH